MRIELPEMRKYITRLNTLEDEIVEGTNRFADVLEAIGTVWCDEVFVKIRNATVDVVVCLDRSLLVMDELMEELFAQYKKMYQEYLRRYDYDVPVMNEHALTTEKLDRLAQTTLDVPNVTPEIMEEFGEEVGRFVYCSNDIIEQFLSDHRMLEPYYDTPRYADVTEKVFENNAVLKEMVEQLVFIVNTELVPRIPVILEMSRRG